MRQGLIDARTQRSRQGNHEMSLDEALHRGLIDPQSEWIVPSRASGIGPTIEERTQETVTETGQQLAPKIFPDKELQESVNTVKRVRRTETSAVGGPGGVSVYRAVTGGKGSIEVPAQGYHVLEAERKGMLNLTNGTVSARGTDKQLSLEEAVNLGMDRIHRKGLSLLCWSYLLFLFFCFLPLSSAEEGFHETLVTRWDPNAVLSPIIIPDDDYDYGDYGQTTDEQPTTTPPSTEPKPPSDTTPNPPNPSVPTTTWYPVVIIGLAVLLVLQCLCFCCCPSVPRSFGNWFHRVWLRLCSCTDEAETDADSRAPELPHTGNSLEHADGQSVAQVVRGWLLNMRRKKFTYLPGTSTADNKTADPVV
ncbi:hypothetical protein niasHT_013094 [Heterodera trifolii]|uniref:Uncharacterized protein n=1 Tax=Heterodera trifolii TaxID=157864 RepID=A0ABD2L8M1_9BILA